MPKTVDNDLAVTDCCPGFGSVAKYTAVSVRECALDVAAMAETSTNVFVYEAMGRHAGWLAAAAGLAGKTADDAPHLILFPERPYDEADFLARVKATVDRVGFCVVVASEGIRTPDGRFVADAGGGKDSFGHTQLGGVGVVPRRSRQGRAAATRCTGPCPTTCSAPRATSRRRPTSTRRRRSARRRWSSRSRA